MGRLRKLLSRTLRTFSLYALLVLTASIPAYYYLVDSIWLQELDEHNRIIAERTEKEVNRLQLNDEELDHSITLWNRIQPGTNLERITKANIQPDTTYTVLRQNMYAAYKDINRFRGLRRFIYINEKSYRLTVETNVEETEETVLAIALITFLFFLILVLGFLLLNSRLSVQLWQPFHSTLDKLKSFNLNHQSNIEFDRTDTFEFEELNTALGRLIEQNIAVFSAQKEFTENASHELQTPLAVITSKLDLLLQNISLTNEQYDIIEEINRALGRVSRINRNLLLLARIENQQFTDSEKIHISHLMQDCLGLLKEYADDRSIAIDTDIAGDIVIDGNRILVELLINNLVLNAIRHSRENARILITLSTTRLCIANSGTEALAHEKIFRRFSRVSNEKIGSGLGLALVKEICRRHYWTIRYEFREKSHEFSVLF